MRSNSILISRSNEFPILTKIAFAEGSPTVIER